MTVQDVLELSPRLEQGLTAAVLLALVLLGVLAVLRPRRPRTPVVLGHAELVWLAVIVVAAAFTRLVGARTWLTVPFSFSELTPLFVADMIDRGTLWHEALARFTQYQAGSIDKSATVLPVAASFQLLFGPSLHLPVLVGAFFGVASIVLAWLLGRTVVGPSFGLVFAALLAASPLQIVWSRLGGIHGTSVTHVLLTLWCAHLAGKRRSIALAIVAGVVVWATLYQYYAARVAIPLAFVFLVAGLRDGHASLGRGASVVAVTALTLVLIYAAARPAGFKETIWPSFSGYVGNRGERTIGEIVRESVAPMLTEAPTAFRRYFRAMRVVAEPDTPAIRWGMRFGGLCLAPIALLGMIGALRALLRCRTEWPWLLFAAAGLAVPLLSVTTARRFVVFDAAWCALAASGLLAILHSPLCRALCARGIVALAAVVLALVTGWSFVTVVVLHGVVAPQHFQPIPFGESGLGDGLTCRRCMQAAWEIRDDVAHGRFVVLFDTDLMRENPTIPGGLSLYGRLAALEAGRPKHFLEFYPVMANRTVPPLERGRYFDPTTESFAAYAIERIDGARPEAIVWHFERPTQWEQWLAERLTAAGGIATTFATPLSTVPGLRVTTPWAAREAAYGVLRELAAAPEPGPARCVDLEEVDHADRPFPLLAVAGPEATTADLPHWTVATWSRVALDDFVGDAGFPAGLGVDAGARRIHALDQSGNDAVYELASRSRTTKPGTLTDVGLGCAVWAGSAWWAVDPTAGALRTTDPSAGSLPAGRWTGIANDGADRIVLASADQQLVVYDVAARREVTRFPATVSPSRRVVVGECSLVAAGREWLATANPLTSRLTVYDRQGHRLGSADAAKLRPSLGPVSAIAASGSYLGIAQGGRVTTVRIHVAPECLAAGG